MEDVNLILTDLGQIVTPSGKEPLAGAAQNEVAIINNGAIAIRGEKLIAVGGRDEIAAQFRAGQTVYCEGRVVTPGFIDCHTHIVFAGSRQQEFEMRIAGSSYAQIAKAGGGILSTVAATREATEDKLFYMAAQRLNRMLAHGATTVEIKTGYGLDTETELKMARVIRRLATEHFIGVVPTFLGAHEAPLQYRRRRSEFVNLVVNEMIPAIVKEKLALFCDIFTEEGVFNIRDSEKILTAAKEAGLKLTMHVDELAAIGGAQLAARLGAVSASHLIKVTEEGIAALARAGTIGILLPGVSFFLATEYAPARRLIEAGVPIALATDCNPGSCYTENMQMILTLAALYLRMQPAEALVGATLNGAAALGLAEQVGSLEPGKLADVVVWDVEDWREIPYHFGVNLVYMVVRKGEIVIVTGE